ncbi:hypothetical protein B0H14DRAFT_1315049 [Mycena olivaceomarginata]|nr:hypothetical protein B0H14DRAFT_1315049 [Mycena olivaceomarginata]
MPSACALGDRVVCSAHLAYVLHPCFRASLPLTCTLLCSGFLRQHASSSHPFLVPVTRPNQSLPAYQFIPPKFVRSPSRRPGCVSQCSSTHLFSSISHRTILGRPFAQRVYSSYHRAHDARVDALCPDGRGTESGLPSPMGRRGHVTTSLTPVGAACARWCRVAFPLPSLYHHSTNWR